MEYILKLWHLHIHTITQMTDMIKNIIMRGVAYLSFCPQDMMNFLTLLLRASFSRSAF